MPSSCPPRRKTNSRAFTILEVLITLGMLTLIFIALIECLDSVDHAWKSGASDPFAEAQNAFETVTANLADATLEPYQDYADATGAFRSGPAFSPDHLARRSDLAFVCGTSGLLNSRTTNGSAVFFVAPKGVTQTEANAGLSRLLNAMGYFVEFGDDDSAPSFLASFAHHWRWRLKQVAQPSESLQVFTKNSSSDWIQQLVPSGGAIPALAENVVALIVLPERNADDLGKAISPTYSYDSRDTSNAVTLHQLPPRLRVVMLAIDAISAERLAAQNGTNPPQLVASNLFQQAAQLDANLATVDTSLSLHKIGHRIFQREIQLPSSAWASTATP